MTQRVGFIGTGDPDAEGFAMAYRHASAYQRLDYEIVACADIVPENAEKFAAEHGIDEGHVYEEYDAMLDEADLDVVGITVPPAIHAPAALACIRSESVRAVHCEKPMATTWGESTEMAAAADRHNVQLTFNHQRRFGAEWQRAKELLDEGAIGELERVEAAGIDLYDWGTHTFDICNMFVDEASPEWVLGQVDYREENRVFGVHNENQGLALFGYDDGVTSLVSTGGPGEGWIDSGFVDCLHRLVGTEGEIEVNRQWGEPYPPLRMRQAGDDEWRAIEYDEPETNEVNRAIEHAMTALEAGSEPAIGASNALRATQLIFGVYESARRRGRVEFPLDIEDHPLEAMVEAGDLRPVSADD